MNKYTMTIDICFSATSDEQARQISSIIQSVIKDIDGVKKRINDIDYVVKAFPDDIAIDDGSAGF